MKKSYSWSKTSSRSQTPRAAQIWRKSMRTVCVNYYRIWKSSQNTISMKSIKSIWSTGKRYTPSRKQRKSAHSIKKMRRLPSRTKGRPGESLRGSLFRTKPSSRDSLRTRKELFPLSIRRIRSSRGAMTPQAVTTPSPTCHLKVSHLRSLVIMGLCMSWRTCKAR